MMWHVYLLRCSDGTIYAGVAKDPKRRLEQHSKGQGSKYVRSRLPADLVYTERYLQKKSAFRREAELKSWSRAQKLALLGQES